MLRGDRIRNLRLERGLTHEEMAELANLNVRQVSRYESGETEPTGEILVRIADVFHVSVDYLLGRTDDPTSYLKVDNLTPKERQVIAAMRHDDIREVLKALVTEN